MSGLNLADLKRVSMKVKRGGIRYDIRYSTTKSTFQLGNAKPLLDPYGIVIGAHGGGVYLQCVTDGKGDIYNTRTMKEKDEEGNLTGNEVAREKTGEFGRPPLRALLDSNGFEGVNEWTLDQVEVEGATHPVYQFVALAASTEAEAPEAEEAEVATEEASTEEQGLDDSEIDVDDLSEDDDFADIDEL
jgi:hypothetical protein